MSSLAFSSSKRLPRKGDSNWRVGGGGGDAGGTPSNTCFVFEVS